MGTETQFVGLKHVFVQTSKCGSQGLTFGRHTKLMRGSRSVSQSTQTTYVFLFSSVKSPDVVAVNINIVDRSWFLVYKKTGKD